MKKNPPPRETTIDGVLERLEQEEPRPIYILYGQERYFVDKALTLLKNKIVASPEMEMLLYHTLAGSEVEPASLHDLARTPPFVGDRQLILVRRAEEIREPGEDLLVEYARNPAPFTCLALEAGQTMPKGECFRAVQERDPDGCIEFPRLKGKPLLRWVCRIGKEKGIEETVCISLAEQILAAVGPDLKAAEREMEKLALCLQDPAGGSASDLAGAIVSPSVQDESYRLIDDVLRGDPASAIRVLHRLLAQGVPPLMLLSRVSWALRRLWQVKAGIVEGESMDRLCTRLRIPFPARETYRSAALRASWRSLRKFFLCLEETDRALKSSRLSPQIHLEDLLATLAWELGAGGSKRLNRARGSGG